MPNLVALENKLSKMQGKTYLYRAENYTITSYAVSESFVNISTDKRLFTIPIQKINTFLSEWLESESDEEVFQEEIKEKVNYETDIQNHDLRAMLMEQINLVKADPKNIQQAKTITGIANTLINSYKLELAMSKEATINQLPRGTHQKSNLKEKLS